MITVGNRTMKVTTAFGFCTCFFLLFLVVLAGSAFQRRVWNELLTIAPGETRSYGGMAAALGSPGASRAIGRANGDNRLGIVVPCHRLIKGDGTLCGYGGGIWRKQWLLDHEAAMVARPVQGPPALAGSAARG